MYIIALYSQIHLLASVAAVGCISVTTNALWHH